MGKRKKRDIEASEAEVEQFFVRLRDSEDRAAEPVAREIIGFFRDREHWAITRPNKPGGDAYSLEFRYKGEWVAKLDVNEQNESKLAVFKRFARKAFSGAGAEFDEFWGKVAHFSAKPKEEPSRQLVEMKDNPRILEAFFAAMTKLAELAD